MNQQETADERWRPILGVESILVSVISMLSDPNDESPANIDAAVRHSGTLYTISSITIFCVHAGRLNGGMIKKRSRSIVVV